VRKEYESKLYELQAELKSINLDDTEINRKVEEKNNRLKQLVYLIK